jgi:putative membrane protein
LVAKRTNERSFGNELGISNESYRTAWIRLRPVLGFRHSPRECTDRRTGRGSCDAQRRRFNFVGQANLGAPFQVDSGHLAETKGTSATIRSYAHLMVTSHIPVVDALNAILQRKNVTPSNTLLHGAYDAMISTLKADHGAAVDRNYVNGQVEYQKGNAALFQQEIQNGADPDLKEFARQTLPKIEDHLQRVLKLAGTSSGGSASN